MKKYRWRRLVLGLVLLGGTAAWLVINPASYEPAPQEASAEILAEDSSLLATTVLEQLETRERASKEGYARTQFYKQWPLVEGCSLRQQIIKRELGDTAVLDGCNVVAGEYDEPYTGEHRVFREKTELSRGVQIDHAVALSNAWQTGAQELDAETRYALATDPLNLIAADASANMIKSDSDAAGWLPDNVGFRCDYVARQISVKYKYHLWVTESERAAMAKVLLTCPGQKVMGVKGA